MPAHARARARAHTYARTPTHTRAVTHARVQTHTHKNMTNSASPGTAPVPSEAAGEATVRGYLETTASAVWPHAESSGIKASKPFPHGPPSTHCIHKCAVNLHRQWPDTGPRPSPAPTQSTNDDADLNPHRMTNATN